MADEEFTVAQEIAKLKRSRNNYKGQIKKTLTRMKNVEHHTTPEIDPANIDVMLESTRNTMRNLEELHESLVSMDEVHEADHDREWEAAMKAMEPVQDELTARSKRGHACIKLERLQQSLDSFVMDAGGSSQQLTDQLLRQETHRDQLQDKFYGIIRHDPHLSGLLAEITAKLGRLNSQLPEIDRPVSASPRGTTEARSRDDGARSHHHRKLPTINIPTFKGDILEWDEFWSVFNRNVHSNSELDDEEKRAYLQQAIKDPSQDNLVDSLAGSYVDCVASLTARYSQPRKLHQHHTRVFFSCPPCKDSSKKEISRILASQSKARKQLMGGKFFNIEAVMESYTEGLLPPDLWREWTRQERDNQTVPKMSDLLEFLEFQVNLAPDADTPAPRRERERAPERQRPERAERRGNTHRSDRPTREVYAASTTHPCLLCKETTHSLYGCPTFLGQTVEQRNDFVTSSKLCYNCLCPSHEKRACKSTYTCRRCNKRHHTLLHREQASTTTAHVNAVGRREDFSDSTINNVIEDTLCPTLSLTAQSPWGKEEQLTALFDTGASVSLITNRVVARLGLKKERCNVRVVQALGDGNSSPTATVQVTLTSQHVPGVTRKLTAVVVPRIGGTEGAQEISTDWRFLEDLPLADPDFRQRRKVDIILGQNIINQIILKGQCQGPDDGLKAQETIWGWTVQGRVGRPQRLPTKETTATRPRNCSAASIAHDQLQADQVGNELLQVFFQGEALDEEKTTSMEDQEALDHFAKTHRVLPGGRFQVSLPHRQDCQELGASRGAALQRFLTNEKSLIRRKALQPFQRVMAEYFELDHAEIIPPADLNVPVPDQYYLPLHAVVKATSTTTKLRIVFDASATSSNGVSLNDTLLIGPTVHPPLTEILLRFRQHRIGMTSDISKMYREISLDPHDRNLHRFFWRPAPTEPIRECRMKRVTFGVTSSPFMATQVLRQVATNIEEESPHIATAIRNDFYVDDFISGAETALQALSLQRDVQTTLGKHHLTLRKWRSSSNQVLRGIPSDLHEKETEGDPYGHQSYQKTLGIRWDAKRDHFYVSISELQLPTTITKRALTSDVARTFDVMGWFAPATLTMKNLIQQLWTAGIGWDEPVPANIQEEWAQWRKELPQLAEQPIPRCYYLYNRGCRREVYLHGFSDASIRGYAAVIYLRTTYSRGPPTVVLLQAKTKVAPIKGLTVPRLELCGAQLLSNLITTVRTALGIPLDRIQCWTDSQIVVYWLDGKSRPHRTFVANRVRRTLEKVPHQYWLHVPGLDNPADCASRGINPGALQAHGLWWHGPTWLSQDPVQRPPQPHLAHLDQSNEEIVRKKAVAAVSNRDELIEERYSTYHKLLRTIAWILRFIGNVRRKGVDMPVIRVLSVTDIEAAEVVLYVRAQERMIAGRKVSLWYKDRTIRSLNPTKDPDGVYRVNGRLQHSPLSYAQRCPIILEGADPLTRLIISHYHIQGEHAGPTLLMSMMGRKHYVIRGLITVKAVVRNCVTCKRQRLTTETQMMGQLPAARITQSRPFSNVGTDFAGPFTLRKGHTRKPVHIKAYVCVFICMATKATHLEIVSSLTSEAFLSCLTRFVSRRGLPTCIYSDNGSNYVGASRELEEIYQLLRKQDTQHTILTYCVNHHISWKFNPARAPHFGGLWEAAVKSFKLHFRRIVKTAILTYEDMTTLLCRIESALNSRPLMPLYTHSSEGVDVLTPGHFLIGQPLNSLPEPGINPERHPRSHFVLCQQLAQQFWTRWSTDYLSQLHKRTKWHKKIEDVAVGDIALIRGENTYRTNDWPMARVIKTYGGPDGLVRAVDLQSGTRIYRRPIAKLTILVRSHPTADTEGIGSSTVDVPLPPAGMSESGKDSEEEDA